MQGRFNRRKKCERYTHCGASHPVGNNVLSGSKYVHDGSVVGEGSARISDCDGSDCDCLCNASGGRCPRIGVGVTGRNDDMDAGIYSLERNDFNLK